MTEPEQQNWKTKLRAIWAWIGCIPVLGTFLALLATAAATYYAIEDYTNGLLLIIAMLLATKPSS